MVAQAAREKEKAQEKAAARRADAERRIQEIWEAEERRAEEDYQERKAAGDAARVESHAERERREEELAQKMWEAEQEAMKPSPKKAKHQPKPATPPVTAEGEAAAPAPAPAPFPAPLSGEYSDGIRVQSVVTTEERREAQAETLKVQQEQRVKDLRKGKVDEESLASKKQALVTRLEAELQRKVGGKGFVSLHLSSTKKHEELETVGIVAGFRLRRCVRLAWMCRRVRRRRSCKRRGRKRSSSSTRKADDIR